MYMRVTVYPKGQWHNPVAFYHREIDPELPQSSVGEILTEALLRYAQWSGKDVKEFTFNVEFTTQFNSLMTKI